MLVLLVDDRVENLSLLELLCDSVGGIRSVTAMNGAEGLALARSLMPEVIISDFDMPVLNGFGFWQALRSEEVTKTIPFALVSSFITKRGLLLKHDEALELIRNDDLAQLVSKENLGREALEKIISTAKEALQWKAAREYAD